MVLPSQQCRKVCRKTDSYSHHQKRLRCDHTPSWLGCFAQEISTRWLLDERYYHMMAMVIVILRDLQWWWAFFIISISNTIIVTMIMITLREGLTPAKATVEVPLSFVAPSSRGRASWQRSDHLFQSVSKYSGCLTKHVECLFITGGEGETTSPWTVWLPPVQLGPVQLVPEKERIGGGTAGWRREERIRSYCRTCSEIVSEVGFTSVLAFFSPIMNHNMIQLLKS